MLYKDILRVVGAFLVLFSLFLIIPMSVAAYYEWIVPHEHPQPHTTLDFFYAFISSLLLGALFYFFGRGGGHSIYRREGIAAVVLIWFLTPAIAAMPFLTSSTLKNPFQAYFEMVSGFTTTGSTILQGKAYDDSGKEIRIEKTVSGAIPTHYSYYGTVKPIRDPASGKIIKEGVEAVGKALLFWRSFTQWLGGVGIVVLFVAVLPALGVGGKLLFQSEISGPVKEGITPRVKDTAVQLWKIYLGLTFLQVVALMVAKPDLPLFEAFVITFSTLATGGFSTQNASIAGYGSEALEWVVILFMILGSLNFSLYYFLVKGMFFKWVDPEFILFMILLPILSLLVVTSIVGTPLLTLSGTDGGIFSWSNGFREGVFQLVSAQTSTGFATVDYDIWPYTAQTILLISMFLGGMSGSTAGGMKIVRILVLFKVAQNKVESIFRPNHVKLLKIGAWHVDLSMVITVLCFFLIVIFIGTLWTLFYVYDGIDPETAIGLTACLQNNVGLAFRVAGPEYSCAFMSDFSLVAASLQMLFGRLEYFALLAILVPAFWRQDS